MKRTFDEIVQEMAATFKDANSIRSHIADIKSKNLPHHYQKPLVAILNDADRDEMIDKIINKVFGDSNFNPDLNTKKELQKALEQAVVEVSKEPGSKFARPVQGTAAQFLGNWLGTNINVEFSRGGERELETRGASVTAAKEVLTKTLTPTKQEKEEIQQAEQPASAESSPESVESGTEVPTTGELKLDQTVETTEYMFDGFSEKIAVLNKKLGKRGVQITLEKTGERMTEATGEYAKGNTRGTKVKLISFRVQVPRLSLPGGWKFVARVDHEDIGNLIVSVPDSGHEHDLHEMFGKSQPSHCDHCGKTRRRTSTFVLEDSNKKLKRVGRQCLKEYLPGGEQEIQKMIDLAEMMKRVALGITELEAGRDDEGMGGEGGGGGKYDYYPVVDALGVTFSLVDQVGYLSKSRARADMEEGGSSNAATASIVESAFNGELYHKVERAGGRDKLQGRDRLEYDAVNDYFMNDQVKQKYRSMANKAIEWGVEFVKRELAKPGGTMREFYQNLSVILNGAKERQDSFITSKYLGYLSSLAPLYNKHAGEQNSKPEGEQKTSEYVGEVGYPIGDLNPTDKRKMKKAGFEGKLGRFPFDGPIPVTVNMTRTIERNAYSRYDSGVSFMYSMTDDQGNVYVYFSSNNLGLEQGDRAEIVRAGVKGHKEYVAKSGKATKQTSITRATINKIEGGEVKESLETASFKEFWIKES